MNPKQTVFNTCEKDNACLMPSSQDVTQKISSEAYYSPTNPTLTPPPLPPPPYYTTPLNKPSPQITSYHPPPHLSPHNHSAHTYHTMPLLPNLDPEEYMPHRHRLRRRAVSCRTSHATTSRLRSTSRRQCRCGCSIRCSRGGLGLRWCRWLCLRWWRGALLVLFWGFGVGGLVCEGGRG